MTFISPEDSYLRFDEKLSDSGKTKVVWVDSVSGAGELGSIRWYGPWRQYCFYPHASTIWSTGCLAEIDAYIARLMDDRKG